MRILRKDIPPKPPIAEVLLPGTLAGGAQPEASGQAALVGRETGQAGSDAAVDVGQAGTDITDVERYPGDCGPAEVDRWLAEVDEILVSVMRLMEEKRREWKR